MLANINDNSTKKAQMKLFIIADRTADGVMHTRVRVQ